MAKPPVDALRQAQRSDRAQADLLSLCRGKKTTLEKEPYFESPILVSEFSGVLYNRLNNKIEYLPTS